MSATYDVPKELRRAIRTERGETLLTGDLADQIKGYVARLEAIDREFEALGKEKARLYGEMRAAGIDDAAVRAVIKRRRAERDEDGLNVARYETIVNAGRR